MTRTPGKTVIHDTERPRPGVQFFEELKCCLNGDNVAVVSTLRSLFKRFV